jgi:hypothetical protein
MVTDLKGLGEMITGSKPYWLVMGFEGDGDSRVSMKV